MSGKLIIFEVVRQLLSNIPVIDKYLFNVAVSRYLSSQNVNQFYIVWTFYKGLLQTNHI